MSQERHREMGVAAEVRRERRGTLRLDTPFPVVVRGRCAAGPRFEEEAVLDNLCADGLYVRIACHQPVGSRLFILVRFTVGAPCRAPGPGVAIRGVVLRADALPDGRYGVALLSLQHRLIFAQTSG